MKRAARTYVIAEAGVNHNGSLALARKLVDAAASAGADAVKFQSFRAEALASATAPKARYQIAADGAGESQLQMLRRLELGASAHGALAARCRSRGIEFLSTPFDTGSLELLHREIGVPLIKIPSSEITNGPFLLAVARTARPVLLSTGMSTLREIAAALGVLAFGYLRRRARPGAAAFREAYASAAGRRALRAKVTLLQCTTAYPAPLAEVNLRAMDTLRAAFGLPVGLSDHSPGIAAALAGVALGATVIEKHLTLDRGLSGPDQRASVEPHELRALVQGVRDVELALGSARKAPTASERHNLVASRRSLVAARDIARGEPFTAVNLACKRPGAGLSPLRYWDLLGKRARRDFRKDEKVAV